MKHLFKEKEFATLRGRVRRVRSLSKHLSFFNLEDSTGSIQIGIRDESLIPSPFDIVECYGIFDYSETKEPTLWIDRLTILSKCEGDLPSFKGIKDGKLSLEKRFLQIITDRKLNDTLVLRSNVLKELRLFLWDKGYTEIETPILSNEPSGATASPFITKFDALNQNFYLRIATETHLKKAIVSGQTKVFEIGKIFRNEGIDKTHNPEFTSIELYSAYSTLNDMKELLLSFISKFKSLSSNECKNYEYDELVSSHGVDFDNKLNNVPSFVYGHPAIDAPLCSLRNDGKCNRFEFYVNNMELANAYQELTNWRLQSDRLCGKNDDGLSEALKYGCPPMAGMGIGIDRLIMYLSDNREINNVIFFPNKKNS